MVWRVAVDVVILSQVYLRCPVSDILMLKLTGPVLDPGIAHPGPQVVFYKIEDVSYSIWLKCNTLQLNIPLRWHSGQRAGLPAGRVRF